MTKNVLAFTMALAWLGLLGIAACGETVVPLDAMTVETRKDAAGAITQVAMNLDLVRVEAVIAEHGHDATYIADQVAEFDADAQALGTTMVAQADYASHGHGPPGVYDAAHFDFHFYGISNDEREAIDCSGETTPASDAVPEGWLSGGTGEPPFGSCVKQMGIHFSPADPSDPSKPLSINAGPQMVFGFSKGKLIFFEPMIPEAIVMGKEPFELDVPRPASLGRAAQWPARVTGAFDDEADVYRIAAEEFSPIE